MNTLKILLPYKYIATLVKLNWYDLSFVIDHKFLSEESAIEHAIAELATEKESVQSVVDLACLGKYESIHPYIDELSSAVSEEEKNKTFPKILYVLLSWVYDHRRDYQDPLSVVEVIYADFDYPSTIAAFARYMPSNQPVLNTLEANIEQLYDNWHDFLEAQKALYNKTF
jgi:hypothetical protein